MMLKTQKRLAAEILKVGINRVKIDPEAIEDVSKAITKDDIRYYIRKDVITVEPKKGISRHRAREREKKRRKGRRRGHGSRKGKKTAREKRKDAWIKKIRALRDELKKMLTSGEIDSKTYRLLYRRAKGNLFHSRRHLREYVEKYIKS